MCVFFFCFFLCDFFLGGEFLVVLFFGHKNHLGENIYIATLTGPGDCVTR